jgi:dTMP kinase
MRTPLVCFCGIDGSGKTTLCRETVKELEAHKIPATYAYGRFLPIITNPFFKAISILRVAKKHERRDSGINEGKRRLLQNPVAYRLFLLGILLDQAIRVLFKIYLPSMFKGGVVICDRYIFDTVILDIGLNCGLSNEDMVLLLRRLLPLFPTADLVFLVDVPPKIAFQRKAELYSLETLSRLENTYLYVGKRTGMTLVDGTRNVLELKSQVLNRLGSVGISLDMRV